MADKNYQLSEEIILLLIGIINIYIYNRDIETRKIYQKKKLEAKMLL